VILPALALFAFGVGDLLRLMPEEVRLRTSIAIAGTLVATWGMARLSGMDWGSVTLTTIVALPAVAWLLVDWKSGPQRCHVWALMLPTVALVGTIAASGSASPVGGSLQDWYENLPLSFAASGSVPVDQFVLGVGAFLFLLATSNRIVVLVLAAAKDDSEKDEKSEPPEPLKGGRFLGPMERLIIAASIVSGDLAGAGFVIAAKGLLRFPEISQKNNGTKIDGLTEYFLVGTFTSVIIAAIIALLLLAAS
jgi:hypothetical protein